MAEKFPTSTETPESEPTKTALRSRARRLVRAHPAASAPARQTRAERRAAGKPHPMRSFFTVAAVAGLVATVAVPAAIGAAGSAPAEAAVTTVQQVAADNAQSLVVASEAQPATLTRGSYTATTPEEIQAKKDEEAAKAAAAARIAAASTSSSGSTYSGSLAETIAPAGSVVRPLPYFDNFGEPYAGHKGTDYMVGRGTPIYAIADGVVVASDEDGPGWGVYIKLAHNVGGQSVTSLYAHMLYGSRTVAVGDTVRAGQIIGQVSDTGRAFGTHLHLEIYVNGSWIYAEDWLAANAR